MMFRALLMMFCLLSFPLPPKCLISLPKTGFVFITHAHRHTTRIDINVYINIFSCIWFFSCPPPTFVLSSTFPISGGWKIFFCLLLSLNLVYMILCISPIESLLPFHRIRSGFLFLSSTSSRVNQLFTDGLGLSPLFSVIFFFQRRMINTDYYTIKKETKCEGQICRPPFSFSFLSVGRRSR